MFISSDVSFLDLTQALLDIIERDLFHTHMKKSVSCFSIFSIIHFSCLLLLVMFTNTYTCLEYPGLYHHFVCWLIYWLFDKTSIHKLTRVCCKFVFSMELNSCLVELNCMKYTSLGFKQIFENNDNKQFSVHYDLSQLAFYL